MDDMRFPNLVKNIAVDEAALAKELEKTVPADRSYVILFTPRSGSSWLTSILSATRKLGYPEEYINPDFLPGVVKATNAREPAQLIAMLKRRRKTPNGVFGMEVRAIDIHLFGEAEFFDCFDSSTIIYYLWRDNLIAQGISLYRAVTTRRYHSTDKTDVPPPEYMPNDIKRWVRHTAIIENDNLKLLQKHGLAARFLRYEDIVRDRTTTISLFCEPMGVSLEMAELQQMSQNDLAKIGDTWNLNTEERFRREEADYVQTIERERLIRREPETIRQPSA
jgi:LPS sulfotransferase NodH